MKLKAPVVVLFFALLLMWTENISAQNRSVRDMSPSERIFVGGFLGLQLGTFTAISVHLHGGYLITDRLSAGLGGNYQYTRDAFFGEALTSHVYGSNFFARFDVVSNFFIHGEYERIQVRTYRSLTNPGERTTLSEDNIFMGVGYGLRASDRVRLNLLLLYNFNDDSRVYLDNPVFRVGVDLFLF